MLTFRIDEPAAGKRLDVFLAATLGDSRAQVRRVLNRGGVRLDGRVMKEGDKGRLLEAGERIEVVGHVPRADERAAPRPDMELRILAEGDGWVAVDKPAGTAVHPLDPAETNTVLNALIARHPEMHSVGEGGLRSGVVHRLDLETSGVLLFATSQDKWHALRDAFRNHTTRKTYRAVVLGSPVNSVESTLDLVVAQHRPAKVRVVSPDPARREQPDGVRRCDLRWRVIEKFAAAALVEIDLGTGFLHQVRVMMSHLGHPVAGDAWYAVPGMPDATNAPRPMLHAASLDIPALGVAAACEPPDDFRVTADRLRAARK
ncbi:MAG: RluA family pseudouridine synthase [Planctomycetes bacterium]|nr:RluA family pseudouridine synthase [Planctomycetota bacterium]